jgi:hypothetical protein
VRGDLDDPTASGDDRVARVDGARKRLGFQAPKCDFAVLFEDLCNRAPGTRLHFLVGIDAAAAKRPGKQRANGRFACST